jgi:hypothetical protein
MAEKRSFPVASRLSGNGRILPAIWKNRFTIVYLLLSLETDIQKSSDCQWFSYAISGGGIANTVSV